MWMPLDMHNPPSDNGPPRWQSGCYLCPSLQDNAPWHTAKNCSGMAQEIDKELRASTCLQIPQIQSDQASVGCARTSRRRPCCEGGWLVYWLGHLSNLMPLFPMFFETILIQLTDRAPRTIFDATAERHQSSNSRRRASFMNSFWSPSHYKCCECSKLHFERKLFFWFSFPTCQIWSFWIEGWVGRHPTVAVVWQVGQETQENKFPTNWTFNISVLLFGK